MSWFKVKVDFSLPVVPSNITHSPCESKGWRDSGVTIITEVVYHVSFPSITKNWIDSRFVIGFFLFRFVVIVWIYSRQSPINAGVAYENTLAPSVPLTLPLRAPSRAHGKEAVTIQHQPRWRWLRIYWKTPTLQISTLIWANFLKRRKRWYLASCKKPR